MTGTQKQLYTCPMHPDIVQDRAGMCPECGMNLVKYTARAGGRTSDTKHGARAQKHAGHHTNIFKTKFWVSFFLSIPVVIYADVVEDLLEYTAPAFPGSAYVPFVLASIIFFYGGWVFLASAYRELAAKMPGMMTLIALAITTAYTYSVYVTIIGVGETLFWELATLITVMLFGHWMEMRAVSGAQSALQELSKLLPDEAGVVRGNKTITVPLRDVRSGELVLVRPGGKIPTDGVVQEGVSEVDESIATGESKPVAKTAGSGVIAGTTNGDGSLTIEVTKIGDETFLAGIMRLVAEAQSSKSRLQMLSDRAAYYLTLIAVVVGGVTFAGWLSAQDTAFAVERLVAVLVIACPHALGLAVPLVASISTTKAAQNGFLVKQRLALEAARKIDTVLFDKTGTLTRGEFGVESVIANAGAAEDGVVRLAASVNSQSEHPIAQATVREAEKRGIRLFGITNFERIAGKGARAVVEGKNVLVGGPALLADSRISVPASMHDRVLRAGEPGKTVVFVIRDKRIEGALALGDVVREESREAVRLLHAMGVKTAMITGDADEVARWVSAELRIDEYFARVLPDQKSEKVKLLQEKGHTVAMVGDGVNDAPALAQADLGIAIGAGTNVAIESAGIILVRDDPRDIPKIITLSRLTYRKMLQNLFWATGYNVIAIPLAAGALAFKGIFLQPALAALLMSLSTVIVAANALLLRRQTLS